MSRAKASFSPIIYCLEHLLKCKLIMLCLPQCMDKTTVTLHPSTENTYSWEVHENNAQKNLLIVTSFHLKILLIPCSRYFGNHRHLAWISEERKPQIHTLLACYNLQEPRIPYTFMGLSRVVLRGLSWSLEDGPTASSIFEYHFPICVEAVISLPVWRCWIGQSTPKTARSARLGFDPPAFSTRLTFSQKIEKKENFLWSTS